MRISKYLDELMTIKGFKRDNILAEWLGVSPPAIAQYRNGQRSMDNEKCVKIALELNIEPTKIIIASDLDKAERTGQKSMWEIFLMRTAASIFLAVILAGVTNLLTSTEAKAAPVFSFEKNQLNKFILCQIGCVEN